MYFSVEKIATRTFKDSEHAVVSTWEHVLDLIAKGQIRFEP